MRIAAVMLSLRIFSRKLQSEQGFLFFFVGGAKNIYFFLAYMIYTMYICTEFKTKQNGNYKKKQIISLHNS